MRTDAHKVRASIDCDETLNLDVFIARANAVTNYVASKDTAGVLAANGLLEPIETILACHYYRLRDPQYSAKATGGASGSFVTTDYWEEAKRLDVTGTLAAMEKGNHVQIIWMGTPKSEQPYYWDVN